MQDIMMVVPLEIREVIMKHYSVPRADISRCQQKVSRASWCIGWAPGGTTGIEHHWYSKQAVTMLITNSMVSLRTRGWWPAVLCIDGWHHSVLYQQEAGTTGTDLRQRI